MKRKRPWEKQASIKISSHERRLQTNFLALRMGR